MGLIEKSRKDEDVRNMTFHAELDNLPEMIGFICKEARKYHISSSLLHKLELASEEVLVNIINYAYTEGKGSIEIVVNNNDHFFEVHFFDKGIPFNPLEKEIDIQSGVPLHERKIGGLGIFLVRKLMDEVEYQRIEDGNKLILRLRTVSMPTEKIDV